MRVHEHLTQHQIGNHVETVDHIESYPSDAELRHARADKENQVLWYIVGVVEALLLLRFLFHLFGANSQGFADLLYRVTNPFVVPFQGIFGTAGFSGGYFDTATLLAMLIIALIGMGIAALIDLTVRPARTVA